MHRTLGQSLLPVALLAAAVACGGNDIQAPPDQTPVTYNVLIDGAVVAEYTFAAGQTSRVQIKFFNAAHHDLDDVEAEHFAGLSFGPGSLASVARVPGHNYQFDVTGGAVGSGAMQVGFGHDDLADEITFPPVAVTVSGSSGPVQ